MFSLTSYKVPGQAALTITSLSAPVVSAVKNFQEKEPINIIPPLLTPQAESPTWTEWMLNGCLGDFLCWSGRKLAVICKDACPKLRNMERLKEMRVNKEELKQFLSLEMLSEDTGIGVPEALNSYLRNGRALVRTEKLSLEEWREELINLKTFSEFTGNENIAEIFSEWIKELDLLLEKKESKHQEHQTDLGLSECKSQQERATRIRDISQTLFCDSTSTIPSVSKESVLKTSRYLLAATAQLELQNQLTQACYDADMETVKDLIEKKLADPFMADKNGQQPMAAAIWGLSLEVMDYLETKAILSLNDWVSIAEFLQNKHGQVIVSAPVVEKEENVVYRNSRGGYDSGRVVTLVTMPGAMWASSDEAFERKGCRGLFNQRLEAIRRREVDLTRAYPSPWDYNQKRNQMTKDRAEVVSEFIKCFNELRKLMLGRLQEKGLVMSEDDKLLTLRTLEGFRAV